MAALVTVGSAGRAADSTGAPRTIAAPSTSNYSSYCLTCASWYFARNEQRCEKCGDPIFRWILTSDLHHLRSRSSLGGF